MAVYVHLITFSALHEHKYLIGQNITSFLLFNWYKVHSPRKVAKMCPYKGQASLMKKKTNHNEKFKEFKGIKKLIAAYS